MTDYVCVPNTQHKGPGFGGGRGSNCTNVDARIVYAEMYRARALARGPGDITAYRSGNIVGAGVNSFTADIASKENFAKYATDFELIFSILTKPERPWGHVSAYTSYRADPVIDDDWLIVGHFGWFKGDDIWVPNSAPRTRGKGELLVQLGLNDIVDSGVEVYVGKRNSESYMWATGDEKYHLLTDVNGRVLQVTNYDLIGLQSAEETLIVLGLVYAAGRVAYAGLKVGIRSLARTFSKAAARRTSRRLLKKIITGDPPYVRVGTFMRPGYLWAEVKVAQGRVTYHVKHIILEGEHTAEEATKVALGRAAHREMIMRTAEIARKNGQKQFKFLGTEANANFRAHADRLAQEVGIPNSGKVLPGSEEGFTSYEVTLDVAKVLAQE
jgi:hypothetical protein